MRRQQEDTELCSESLKINADSSFTSGGMELRLRIDTLKMHLKFVANLQLCSLEL